MSWISEIRQHSWRYVAPNAVTSANVLLGVGSLVLAGRDATVWAAWLIIIATMTDRLDGIVARALNASSSFGMQLDSFADFLNFGVAPAFLLFSALSRPTGPFSDGVGLAVLGACAGWYVLAAAFRLARFNVLADATTPTRVFQGVPSTMVGGLVAIWYLALHKYDAQAVSFGGAKLLAWTTPAWVWQAVLLVMVVGGALMVSSVAMPKGVGGAPKFVKLLAAGAAFCGALGTALQLYPEIIAVFPSTYFVAGLVVGRARYGR